MPPRPRALTQAAFDAQVQAYCAAYAVTRTPQGFLPFPAGQRETPQHREWVRLYKAWKRLQNAPAQSPLDLDPD